VDENLDETHDLLALLMGAIAIDIVAGDRDVEHIHQPNIPAEDLRKKGVVG
jgi:hypothetical protein